MAGIIEKRRSLHSDVTEWKHQTTELQSQLSQLQALANIGTLSCMIAHEMNNILTPLANYAQLALNNPQDQPLTQKALQKTASNAVRAAKVLESMLAIANGEKYEKTECRLKLMIDDVFSCICRDFAKDRIKVTANVEADLTISVIPIQFQQVLMNLILNARDAMTPRGGQLTISATCDNAGVIIKIADTGCGIAYEHLDRIFEPFFTTKSHNSELGRNGAGLGLPFCRQIVESHAGRISVESKPAQGSTFTIILPQL